MERVRACQPRAMDDEGLRAHAVLTFAYGRALAQDKLFASETPDSHSA
jgi:hypothetical protein